MHLEFFGMFFFISDNDILSIFREARLSLSGILYPKKEICKHEDISQNIFKVSRFVVAKQILNQFYSFFHQYCMPLPSAVFWGATLKV